MKAAIFDLDGTLADTSADLIAAANNCFSDLGHRNLLDPQKDAATAFAGGRAMLKLGFSRLKMGRIDDLIEQEFPKLLMHYERDIDVFTSVYPGVETCLTALKSKGYALGVCTNKPEKLAEKLLVNLGLRPWFGAVLGADTLTVRKPDPRHLLETIRQVGGHKNKSVLIGDTVTDRMAAQNAGVPCVLVTFGPNGRSVEDLTPEALLDHYDDLPALLETMTG